MIQHKLNLRLIDALVGGPTAPNQVRAARVQAALAAGSDPNARWVMMGSQPTTMLIASAALAEFEITRMLIRRGANVNARGMCCSMRGMEGDFRDSTALIDACMLGDIDIVDLLLTHGADVNVRQRHGFSPLSASIWAGQWTETDTLLRHGAHPSTAERREIALHRCASKI